MIKPFDLEYYLAHQKTKVVTRDGRDVRILCTDLKRNDCPIVASCLNTTENLEDLFTCTTTGKLLPNSSIAHPNDLFFDFPDPKKRLVPLTYEDLLERIKSGKTMWLVRDQNTIYNIVDFDANNVYYIFGDADAIHHLSYEVMMGGIIFADGDPCWKEVDE